jgi:hypothetical protein
MAIGTEHQNIFWTRDFLYGCRIWESFDGLYVAILYMFVVTTRLAHPGPMSIEQPRDAVEVTAIVTGVLDGIFGFQLCHGQQQIIGFALAM